jgi:tetratricopeptide (TPR) repeat protein
MSQDGESDARDRSIRDWADEIRDLMGRDMGRAMRAAKEATTVWPQSGALMSLRAEILVMRGQLEDAAKAIKLAQRLGPIDVKSQIRLAQASIALGRFSQARSMIKAVQLSEPAPDVILLLAASLIEIGEYGLAIGALVKAREATYQERLQQLRARAHTGLEADERAGVGPEGKRDFSAAMDLLRDGRAGEAEPRLADVTRAWPGYAPAWIGLRGALEVQGKTDEAASMAGTWAEAAPSAGPTIAAATGRRLSGRGLLFDPREPFALRPKADALVQVSTPAELKSVDNAWLQIDAGGEVIGHAPVFAFDRLEGPDVKVTTVTPETFVASIRNPMLVGRGVAVSEDLTLVDEITLPNPAKFDAGYSERGPLFDRRRFRDGMVEVRCFDEPAVLLAGPTDRSFGDWIINFPPRLTLAQAAGLDCKILVAEESVPTAEAMLAALGVDPGRLLRHDPFGVSIFPKLYVPSWPMIERLNHMKDPFAIYRRAARPPRAERPRIWLSREGISKRPMLNEPEVRALFERHGFISVRPERLSFEEVLELFAGPACVAGGYGSGLLNMVFSSARPPTMFIAPPEPALFLREAISWLGALELPFGYVRGEPADKGDGGGWIAPMDLVEQGLEALLELERV